MSVGKLTGPKKAAILLLALGEDGAAEVMKNLEESEIQQVGYYMTRFTDVAPEELDIVLEEFYRNSVMQEEGININASPDFVKNALSKALGAEKAKELEGNLRSGQEEGGLDALRYIDPVMVSNYIRGASANHCAGALLPQQHRTVLDRPPQPPGKLAVGRHVPHGGD